MSEAGSDPQQEAAAPKPKECLDISQVHSANSWEKVELGGDDDRKKKFLRLMGAGKKQHQGRFVIGDQDQSHGRERNDPEAITSGLEKQFTVGLEHKFAGGPRSHIGLGFQDSVPKETNSSEKPEETGEKCEEKGEKCEEKGEKAEEKGEKSEEKTETSQKSDEKCRHDNKNDTAPKHKMEDTSDNNSDKPQTKMMKGFVKSSS